MKDLENHVQHIAENISKDFDVWCEETAKETDKELEEISIFDYLEDVLEFQYIVTANGDYLGARLLVAFGGPNIWVDTQRKTVEGYWWGDYARKHFDDNIGLDDACRELWELNR